MRKAKTVTTTVAEIEFVGGITKGEIAKLLEEAAELPDSARFEIELPERDMTTMGGATLSVGPGVARFVSALVWNQS